MHSFDGIEIPAATVARVMRDDTLLGTLSFDTGRLTLRTSAALTAAQQDELAWLTSLWMIWRDEDRRAVMRGLRASYRDAADMLAGLNTHLQGCEPDDDVNARKLVDELPVTVWHMADAAERAADVTAILAPLALQQPELRLGEQSAIEAAFGRFMRASREVSSRFAVLHHAGLLGEDTIPAPGDLGPLAESFERELVCRAREIAADFVHGASHA